MRAKYLSLPYHKDATTTVVQSIEIDFTVVITDPCYIIKDSDWPCSLKDVGVTTSIENTTYYGDWGCTVWKASKFKECKEDAVVGHFCADVGKVCVVNLDEALKYNPSFEQWIKDHDWCVTILKDFKGRCDFVCYTDDKDEYIDKTLVLYFIDEDEKVQYIAAQTSL